MSLLNEIYRNHQCLYWCMCYKNNVAITWFVPHERDIKLVDYLHVQADKPWYILSYIFFSHSSCLCKFRISNCKLEIEPGHFRISVQIKEHVSYAIMGLKMKYITQ